MLLWVAVSTTVIGVAICSRWTALSGIRLLGYGIAAGVVVHGLAGLGVALCWRSRLVVACVPTVLAIVAIVDLTRRGVRRRLIANLTRPQRVSLLLWCVFLVCCVAVVHVHVRWPATLPDGLYVFKKHRLHTKIQYLTGFPADNYIPYTVTEFFARGISFRETRPILPGNEVSNRTILMSLVALPFRTILRGRVEPQPTLGKFSYVGAEWPDVQSLNDDGSFQQSLIIGIFLNSLLLVALLVFFAGDPAERALPAAVLLFVTNAYFIGQTIFTWPKALAGFFLVLAWDSLRRNGSIALAAACAALAYHSHPSSIAAVICLAGWVAWRARRTSQWLSEPISFAGIVLLLLLPWFVWTQFVLQIPSNLLWQNLASPVSSTAMESLVDFLWVRVVNLFDTFTPLGLGVYPFELGIVVAFMIHSLPIAVGLLLIVPAFREVEALFRTEPLLVVFGFVIPCTVLLLLFSYPAVPIVHGFQPVIGALLFLAVLRLRRTVSSRAFTTLVVLQLVANLGLLAMRAAYVGLH